MEEQSQEALQSAADAKARKAGAPDSFFCPVSFTLMRDPVMIETGHTYERDQIQKWLAANETDMKCPATGSELSSAAIYPNIALRRSIEEFCEQNQIELPPAPPPPPPPRPRRQAAVRNDDPGGMFRQRQDHGITIAFGLFPNLFGLQFQQRADIESNDGPMPVARQRGHRIVVMVAMLLLLGLSLM